MSKLDEFDDWLMSIDDKLEQLEAEVPDEVADKLDYSPESLSVLEAWLLRSYASEEEIFAADKYLLDRLSAYVGETFRKNLGGIWTIDYSNKKSAFYGFPVIAPAKHTAPEAPLLVVTAALDRRQGNYMEKVLRNMMQDSHDSKG